MMDQRYSDNETSRRDIPSFIEPRPPLIQNPFMRPRPQRGLNLLEQFEDDSEIEEPELVQVYLRMKPCNVPSNLYEVKSDKRLVTSMDTTTAGHGRRTQHNVSRMYTFSRIFTSECNQKEIFEQVVKDNLKKLPDGHSFTLLTYGASGSGKTYTLMGTVTSPGLVPRALEYVFNLVDAAQMPTYKPSDTGADQLGFAQQDSELMWVKRLRHVSAPLRDKYRRMSAQLHNELTVSSIDLTNRTKYYVWVSFVEIYNEAIYDLLAPPEKRVKMRIREDTAGNVYVKDVTQAFVRSGEEAYDVMVAGKHNLIVAATGIHAQSSRSHCIFTITMLTESDGVLRTSHVRLCDLAGCERQRAARNTGARMQESRAINSSLHVLERCLHMLRRKQRQARDASMVPYRESKLTRLLGSGLSGARGEAVSMVVTLNPAPQYAHESRHVLSLAAVAQDIQINNTTYASTLSTLESSTQDTTICSSAEVMKLRSDNERLHFELIQSQARNKELLASMEENQQQTASTMQELVKDTKYMMCQFYETQIQALKAEMEDMIEEYESRLAKSAAPPVLSVGTPTRFLQSKVAQLMTEITVLEDQLSEEKLARSRAEKEVQHLRNCIEERDEKALETSTENQNEVMLIDSDHESEDDTSDPFNESLEPVFKKERDGNISHIVHTPKLVEKSEVVETMETVKKRPVKYDEFDNEGDKSNDILKYDNTIVTPRDSMYATGDDESELVEESKQVESPYNSMANITETIDDINVKKTSYRVEETDNSAMNDTMTDNDKSECEEFFHVSTKVHDEADDEIKTLLIETNVRGTYFVNNDESQKECTKGDQDKHQRDMHFTPEQVLIDKKLDIEDATEKDKQSVNEIIRPKKVSETLVNKIIQSMKISQSSNSSLTQFEQLEMAANNVDNSKDKSTDFVDTKILKQKKTYFTDTTKKLSNKIDVINKQDVTEELPAETRKSDDSMFDVLSSVKKQEKSKYVKDKTYEDDIYKLQQLPSVGNNISDASTSSKKQEKPSYFEDINDKSKTFNLSSAAKVQAKLLYFDDNHKTKSNDVIISRSGTKPREMRSYFDNIDVDVASATNKNVNDIIVHSLKDQERSPSIVKDETSKDYEPSNAIKNLLRESFTKPDFSSIHKSKVLAKKHDSLDIFESPQINVAIDKEAISKTEVKNNIDSEKTKENNIEEAISKAKELSNVEVIRKSIERLVLEQKIKADVKQEIKSELSSSIEEFAIDNGQESKTDSKEVQKDNIDVTVSSDKTLNDTQFVKENNTIDEFENICKDLSTVRATEFELLVPQDVNASNVNNKACDQEWRGGFKVQEKNEEVSERTKKFEETKYNLRNKDKSRNFNVSDDKGKEIEEILAKSHFKCDSKAKTTTKRSLRLRRRKNQDNESSDQDNESKLKDILNLKKEFSDVTMGLPAVKREVKDIPSPEKLPGEEENLPPMLGIQSCPSKSITRSRRKLFTPRAEPLEESLVQTGDSNERIYVPRPSYHRARARRKL